MDSFNSGLCVTYNYITNFSWGVDGEEAKAFKKDHMEKLYMVELSYLVPLLSPDIKFDVRRENIRYVVGVVLGVGAFQKLASYGTLNLCLEPDFENKLRNAEYVCISAPSGATNQQQVVVIGKNDRVFNTTEELVEHAEKFIEALNGFYNSFALPTEEQTISR